MFQNDKLPMYYIKMVLDVTKIQHLSIVIKYARKNMCILCLAETFKSKSLILKVVTALINKTEHVVWPINNRVKYQEEGGTTISTLH